MHKQKTECKFALRFCNFAPKSTVKFRRKSRYVNSNHALTSKRTSFAERGVFLKNGCKFDEIKALPVDKTVESVNK